jgi:hypothetical protein
MYIILMVALRTAINLIRDGLLILKIWGIFVPKMVNQYLIMRGPCFRASDYEAHHYNNMFYDTATDSYCIEPDSWFWQIIPTKNDTIWPKAEEGKIFYCRIHILNDNPRRIIPIPKNPVERSTRTTRRKLHYSAIRRWLWQYVDESW